MVELYFNHNKLIFVVNTQGNCKDRYYVKNGRLICAMSTKSDGTPGHGYLRSQEDVRKCEKEIVAAVKRRS